MAKGRKPSKEVGKKGTWPVYPAFPRAGLPKKKPK